MNSLICQSCGLSLNKAGDRGTFKDGKKSLEYCRFCFKSGSFIEPEMTLPDMINRVALFMNQKNRLEEKTAQKMAQKIIPRLKRWQNHQLLK